MKAAFALWKGRIAPVFDVARDLCLVEAESGQIVSESEATLMEDLPTHKANRLAELGAGTLVCGAISQELLARVRSLGVQVIPFISGEVREVIDAWLRDSLQSDLFSMPGCYGEGRRRRGGRGRGRSGGAGGRRGMGPPSLCRCPSCGHQEPHEPGVPCAGRPCPQCGLAMTRQ